VCLPTLTYNEAWELSYFGANVLHPRTTLPAMRYKIPIAIRNFFNLDAPGGRQAVCKGGWNVEATLQQGRDPAPMLRLPCSRVEIQQSMEEHPQPTGVCLALAWSCATPPCSLCMQLAYSQSSRAPKLTKLYASPTQC
jgi:hypothetical protein